MVGENLFKGSLKSHGIFNFLVTGNYVVTNYALIHVTRQTVHQHREGLWTVGHIVGIPKLPSLKQS